MSSPDAGPPRRCRPARLFAAVAALALVATVVVFAAARAGSWLVVADADAPADAAVVLAGNPALRGSRAADLYRSGRVHRIVLTTPEDVSPLLRGIAPPEVEVTHRLLMRLGVPDSAIVVLRDTVHSTREEAAAVDRHLVRLGTRIIVVTSDVHTRRTRCTFRRRLGGRAEVQVVPAFDARYDLRRWWRSEAGLLAVFLELAKTAYHFPC